MLGRAPRGADPGSRVLPAAMDRQLKEAMYANVTKSIPFLQGLEPEVVGNLGAAHPPRVCACVWFRAPGVPSMHQRGLGSATNTPGFTRRCAAEMLRPITYAHGESVTSEGEMG
eukprot:COSAG01_NODE_23865_length_799_cov_0.794286_1_plen_114_part_00